MNNDQIEIITQYLRIETNYAVIINGLYGVGKTHFYKNELVPRIKEISLSKDERKKFIPIHISLFGFKTLKEIQTAIFVELFPILKNKGLKLAAGIGKSIVRGIAQINKAGDIDKYIDDLSLDGGDWLKYDELVICFDDLDRKSEKLDLRDVFGFINSIVENQGAKVLIIANEEQLIKDINYSSSLREKVIGVSVLYNPDPKIIYKQIIKVRYSTSSTVFFEFLTTSEDEIVNVIELNQNNFRNLIFFLEHFKTIFYPLEDLFQTDRDFAVQKEEKLKAVLNFSLAIAVEYKLGSLNSTNLDDIKEIEKTLAHIDIALFLENKKIKEANSKEPTYIEIFKKKYFSNNKYYFFKSIFEYITGSKAFDIINLKKEINEYFIVKDGAITKQDEVLNKLGYLDCLKLSDKEYRELTLKMLSFANNGKYQLRQYGTVFHFATRFNNLLNFDLVSLKERLKKGILKGKPNYSYNYDLDFYMSVNNEIEFKDDVLDIVRYCLKVNESLEEAKNESSIDDLFRLFQVDFNSFIEKVKDRDSEFRFAPFWLQFDIKKIVKCIDKMDNVQIWNLGNYFTNRYRKQIYEKLYAEKTFIIKLREMIDAPSQKRNRKTLQNASKNYLIKCLSESELNFPS